MAVQWSEDRSVLRIATAGSRRKTIVADVILAVFFGFFLISVASSSLGGLFAVLAGVLIAAAAGLALFALRRHFSYPYVELSEAGIKLHKRYLTTPLKWDDVEGFSHHEYRGNGGRPGGARVWQLGVNVRSSRAPLRCEVVTVSNAERAAIVEAIRPFEGAHDLAPLA